MSRIARIAIAAATLLPLAASAGGYGKTSWGMTHEQVEKLFPGGTREAEPDGSVSYFVFRKIEGLEAMIGFTFEAGRLVYVAERFPDPDQPVRKEGIEVPIPSNAQAASIAKKLRKALEKRYGRPFADATRGDLPSSPNIQAAWITADGGTLVTLDFHPMTDGPRTIVGVSYGKWPPPGAAPEAPAGRE